MEIIKARALKHFFKRYDEDGDSETVFTALDGVDITIEAGEWIAIVGRNGSGKSTLARHLNALLLPDEGTVEVAGLNTLEERELWKVRQKAGMVFQNADNQIVSSIVEDDVAFGPENLGVESAEIERRVAECLGKVGMYAYRSKSPNRLSGGQKQRVAIAGVAAMQPSCMILDESTAMLDPKGRSEVLAAVRELNENEGITVIWITHYMDETLSADRIYVMDKGRVERAGTPKEIFSDPEFLKAKRLELPPIAELAASLKERGLEIPAGIVSGEELAAALKKLGMDGTLLEKAAEGQSGSKAEDKAEGTLTAQAAESAASSAEARAKVQGAQDGGAAGDAASHPEARAKSAEDEGAERVSHSAEGGTGTESRKGRLESARPQLAFEDVSFSYSVGTAYETKVLSHVDLKIMPGEFCAIIGHTGSGKSTLIQHMNALLKPQEGRVLFMGEDVWEKGFDRRALRTRCGMVFQYPESQLFETDVLTDCAFGPKNKGLSDAEAREKAKKALAEAGVSEELFGASPFELSGGQKRSVAIAGILAMEPEVLILDEPTAGLDPAAKDDLLANIKRLNEENGTTIVLISHSMDDVGEYAGRVIAMSEGQVAFDGTPREVFSKKEELSKLGLGVPQVTDFMAELAGGASSGECAAVKIDEAADIIARAAALAKGGAK